MDSRIFGLCCNPRCLALAVPLRKKFASLDTRIFHRQSVVIYVKEPSEDTDRIINSADRVLVMLSVQRKLFSSTCRNSALTPNALVGVCPVFDLVFVPVDFKHCASYGFAFVSFLNADRAGQFRTYFFQYAKTCQDVNFVVSD